MELSQQNFEERGLLEMLNKATSELQPNINMPKRYYKYIFTLQGNPVLSLRQIDSNTQALIVSDNKQFKGVFSSLRIMSFDKHRQFKDSKGKFSFLQQMNRWYENELAGLWTLAE
jgi:hypothetical protein